MPFKDPQRRKEYDKNRSPREDRASYHRKWYKKNKARIRKIARVYARQHPEKNTSSRLKTVFGITLDEYNDMLKSQDERCAICGRHYTEASRDKRRLAVDHDHKTGRIRGLLCTNCNGAIGRFSDSVELMSKAIEYLNLHSQKL